MGLGWGLVVFYGIELKVFTCTLMIDDLDNVGMVFAVDLGILGDSALRMVGFAARL